MSLFDFFFPEQAQASHLRKLTEQNRASRTRSHRTSTELKSRVDALEDDLGYVTLILGSILDALDKNGVVTRADLKVTLDGLDAIDGVKDGKLDINVLRGRHT